VLWQLPAQFNSELAAFLHLCFIRQPMILIHFTCVGRGLELKRLQQMVQGMGLEDTVEFTRTVSDQD
jgi:hypothetical protein